MSMHLIDSTIKVSRIHSKWESSDTVRYAIILNCKHYFDLYLLKLWHLNKFEKQNKTEDFSATKPSSTYNTSLPPKN
jgi:hypothetical protein